MLTCVVLPVEDTTEIKSVLEMLNSMRREGEPILPEVVDWMDWAERVLDLCLIMDSAGTKAGIQIQIPVDFSLLN